MFYLLYLYEPSPASFSPVNIVEGRGQRVEETKRSIVWEPDGKRNLATCCLASKIQVDFKLLLIMIVIFCWWNSWYKLMKENYYRVLETEIEKKHKLKAKNSSEWELRSCSVEQGARSDSDAASDGDLEGLTSDQTKYLITGIILSSPVLTWLPGLVLFSDLLTGAGRGRGGRCLVVLTKIICEGR